MSGRRPVNNLLPGLTCVACWAEIVPCNMVVVHNTEGRVLFSASNLKQGISFCDMSPTCS